jgi:hypothetical protein
MERICAREWPSPRCLLRCQSYELLVKLGELLCNRPLLSEQVQGNKLSWLKRLVATKGTHRDNAK